MDLLQRVYSFLCENHFKSNNDYTFGDSWHLKEVIPTAYYDLSFGFEKDLPEERKPNNHE